MALIMFCQSFFSASFLSFADVIFNNSLRTLLPKNAPEVNAEAVIAAGASGFRAVVPSADLQSVLEVYAKSIDGIFYLTVGAACAAWLTSWAMGWKDIRKKDGSPGGLPAAPTQSEKPKTDV